jgi:hypothetical protein
MQQFIQSSIGTLPKVSRNAFIAAAFTVASLAASPGYAESQLPSPGQSQWTAAEQSLSPRTWR